VPGPFDSRLLDGTGWGARVVDVVVGAPADLEAMRQMTPSPKVDATSAVYEAQIPAVLSAAGPVSAERRFIAWARRARTGETYGPWRVMRTRANGEHFLTRDAELSPSRQVTHH
jgi:hypothetical protein